MMRKLLILATAALVVGLAILARDQAQAGDGLDISILSSSPGMVSGGDALVRVDVPSDVALGDVTVKLNGVDITAAFAPAPDGHALAGLVDGFVLGENTLNAKANGKGAPAPAQLTVTNYPITGPIFSGPQQQAFVCTTARAGLGQPLVDNQDQIGIRVAQEDAFGNYPRDSRGYPTAAATIVGYSKDCSANTLIVYRYRTTAVPPTWKPLADPSAPLPLDIAYTRTMDGDTVPYIVRWERGTINRFIYSVAMLAPTSETDPSDPSQSLWNGKLVFSFQGGVAIGHTQGTTSTDAQLLDGSLRLGYAVVNSTGLRTNTHYNLQLGGETALMLKEHFIESHGVPVYTVGVGGSGGAIQQYVYGQNHPGLLDAAIPQYSYPDMVTQTIHVGDCELLERYFDVTDGDNPKWLDVENRQAIQGLNASSNPKNLSTGEKAQWNGLYFLYGLLGLPVPTRDDPAVPALTECRNGWFGLGPLVLNPTFTNVQDIDKLAQGTAGVEWTHWGDLVNIYGTDESGFARVPWDNVGVQYGLQALLDGVITPGEFLDLNANVGSWKESKDQVTEGFPFVGGFSPANFDPWSSRNMNLSPDGGITPAPRRAGDILAMNAAYNSGMVFDGKIDIPIIDWRHYLEDELDMHHSHQSFASRQRMIEGQGHADNQVIWFTDARPAVAFDQTPQAFEVIDEWMANIKANPGRSVAENKPADAVDRCFNTDGSEFARGDGVWDGILNDEPAGACTGKFQIYSSSRIVSGGPLKGGIFKCQRQSVNGAIRSGVYGWWNPTKEERTRLNVIFPTGVCDYSLPDAGRPVD